MSNLEKSVSMQVNSDACFRFLQLAMKSLRIEIVSVDTPAPGPDSGHVASDGYSTLGGL